tara:strand:+ start:1146 stop:1424 length:279 start_codon:yes stop_codon:yes gene_type:complete
MIPQGTDLDLFDADYICINVGTESDPIYLFGDTEAANKMRLQGRFNVPTCFDNSHEKHNDALSKFEESFENRDRHITNHGIWGGCHEVTWIK